MSQTIKSIDVNQATGEAFVAYNDNLNKGWIARIDQSNAYMLDQIQINTSGDLHAVLIEQTYNSVIPFYYEIEPAAAQQTQDFSFTWNGVTVANATFDSTQINLLSQQQLFEADTNTPNVAPTTNGYPNTTNPNPNVMIWSETAKSGYVVASEPGLPYENKIVPQKSIKLPKFSWNSIAFTYNPVLLVGYANGGISGYMLSNAEGSSSHASTGEWKVDSSLFTKTPYQLPNNQAPITGIAAGTDFNACYISAGNFLTKIGTYSGNPIKTIPLGSAIIAQIQTSDEIIWGIDPNEGNIFTSNDADAITTYGVFESPIKVIWSIYHQAFIVGGEHIMSRFYYTILDKQDFFGTNTDIITDFDVSSDGLIAVVANPTSPGNTTAKIIDRDGYRILARIDLESTSDMEYQFVKCVFIDNDRVIFACQIPATTTPKTTTNNGSQTSSQSETSTPISSSINSSQSMTEQLRFYLVNPNTKTTTSVDYGVDGNLISLCYDDTNDIVVGLTDNGSVFFINNQGVAHAAGKIPGAITVGCLGPYSVSENLATQSAIRVYVGSQQGQNDRWDSGNIQTNQTSILYGGGDNLVPGQVYWVHIAVEQGGVWSLPQIQSFAVPKQE